MTGLSTWRWRQEDWKFKVTLCHQLVKEILSYRRPCQKNIIMRQGYYFNTYCLGFYLLSWYLLVYCGGSIDDTSHATGFWKDKHYTHLCIRLSSSWASFTRWNWNGRTKWHLSSSILLKRNLAILVGEILVSEGSQLVWRCEGHYIIESIFLGENPV